MHFSMHSIIVIRTLKWRVKLDKCIGFETVMNDNGSYTFKSNESSRVFQDFELNKLF